MNISLLVPTRNRPIQLRKLIISAYETASDPDSVEFCFYINDEGASTDSEEVITSFNNKNLRFKRGEKCILGELWNRALELATADILWHGNDDIVFRTSGWDKVILDAFEACKDKILFVYPANGNPKQQSGTHGFLHRNWVDVIGYFTAPYFSSDCCDGWLNEVAISLGRRVFVPNVLLEHMHFTLKKSSMDSVYAERIEAGVRDNVGQIYLDKAPERLDNIRKLQEFIDNYGEIN